jgi:hypothetical protein
VQCTGEENYACRCFNTTAGNKFIFCFFFGHFKILSYCIFRGGKYVGNAHACQSVFRFSVLESLDCRV